jgi:glycogen operon protein
MLLGGDEIGRTQRGNNNAYCQDSDTSWFDWESADRGLCQFTRRVIEFRRQHPVFRRRRWFKGAVHKASGVKDIAWLKPDAGEMSEQDWTEGSQKSFMLFLNGRALRSRDAHGRRVSDDSFVLMFNAQLDDVVFTVPGTPWGGEWIIEFDTALDESFSAKAGTASGGSLLERSGLSVLVLRRIEAALMSDRHDGNGQRSPRSP